jgi:hypothetical protein
MTTDNYLRLTWSTSRAVDTYGYNIARLDDTETHKRYRCNGGGYDMVGTVFAEWLQDRYQGRLQAIGSRAYYVGTTVHADGFYGMRYLPSGTVTLDGGCGLESIRRIAQEIGLEVRQTVTKRGHVDGFIVHDTRSDES